MRGLLLLLLPLLVLGACGEKGKNYVLKVKLRKLTQQEFYNKDLVYDVIFDSEEQNTDSLKKRSRELFLQAIDLSKNKRKPAAAVLKFKESILVFPEAKSYYELGNSLMQLRHQEEEALKAYEVAEHLQFQPKSKVYYQMALANGALFKRFGKDEYESRSYYSLESAVENGLSDTIANSKDPRLAPVLALPRFQNFLAWHKAKNLKDNTDGLFALFRNSFPVVQHPFEIPLEKVDMKDYTRSVSYDFVPYVPEMQNVSFGREVSHEFFFVAKVAETPAYTALVYSSVGFYSEAMQPVQTKLVTFGNDGSIISSLLLSCQCSAEKVKKGTIDQNKITLQDYKRIWKQPIDKVDFEENSIEGHELLATATYRIADNGKIEAESVPENYRDNGLLALQLSAK